MVEADTPDLRSELQSLLNKHSRENGSNTPDFILAQFLMSCLDAYDAAVRTRDTWYNFFPRPGWGGQLPTEGDQSGTLP